MGWLTALRRKAPAATQPASAPPAASTGGGEAAILPHWLFDEQRYLATNPDVAEATARGCFTAYDHYVHCGHREEMAGRRPRSLPRASQSLSVRNIEPDALVDRIVELEIEKRALLEAWDRHRPADLNIDFDMLSEPVEDALVPPLDRLSCDERELDPDQRHWREHGYVIKSGFIPDPLIDRYCQIRERVPATGGWSCPVPYMYIPELRDVALYRPLTELLERLVGEEMGLHLNLTGWVSTDRNWHQDDYLNPPYINCWYAAVWIALDDIHPDSGPFEFVPGSHKWPLMKSHKVRLYLDPEERQRSDWPFLAERFVNGIAEREIARRGIEPKRFIAKKGDVLVWHGRLMHRGSYANVPLMQRKALIGHYSGISHRVDMPVVERTADGSAYFVLNHPLDFDPYNQAVAAE